MTFKSYLSRSNDLAVSFLMVLPLLVFYEVGIVLLRSPVKNAADVILKGPLKVAGPDQVLVFNLVLLALIVIASISLDKQRKRIDLALVVGMIAESTAYAILLSIVSSTAVTVAKYFLAIGRARAIFQQIVLSVGAGVYEEVLFRLILLGAALFVCSQVLNMGKWTAGIVSVTFSSAIFALMHYVGPLGDRFAMDSFIYRTAAGAFLATIYVTRGFGIAVYTHAIYDVLLVFYQHL